jgi:hypothetical protein
LEDILDLTVQLVQLEHYV